jgi:ADP-ribose pyrophosphatase YjhB (NUDIX family)
VDWLEKAEFSETRKIEVADDLRRMTRGHIIQLALISEMIRRDPSGWVVHTFGLMEREQAVVDSVGERSAATGVRPKGKKTPELVDALEDTDDDDSSDDVPF